MTERTVTIRIGNGHKINETIEKMRALMDAGDLAFDSDQKNVLRDMINILLAIKRDLGRYYTNEIVDESGKVLWAEERKHPPIPPWVSTP